MRAAVPAWPQWSWPHSGIWILFAIPFIHGGLLFVVDLGTPVATVVQLLRPLGTLGAVMVLLYSSRIARGKRRWSYLALAGSWLGAAAFSLFKITQDATIEQFPMRLLWIGIYGCALVGAALYLSQRQFWNGTTLRVVFDGLVVGLSTFLILHTVLPPLVPAWGWSPAATQALPSLSFDLGIFFVMIVVLLRYQHHQRFVVFLLLHVLCLGVADSLTLLTAWVPSWRPFQGDLFLVYPLYTLQSVLLAYALYQDARDPLQRIPESSTPMPLRELIVWSIVPQGLLYSALLVTSMATQPVGWLVVGVFGVACVHTLLVAQDYRRVLQNLHRAETQTVAANTQLVESNTALQQVNQQLTDLNQYQSRIQFARANENLAVVHDIRAELRHIAFVVDQPQLDDQVRTTLASSVQALQTLASDMFDAAQLQQDRLVLTIQSIDLFALVTHIVGVYDIRYAAHQCVLTMIIDEAPPHVRGDADRLARVIRNVLENALRYTAAVQTRGGVVEVWFVVQPTTVTLAIRDNGAGIAAADLRQLQRRIKHLLTAERYPAERTGLGLTICARLLALQQGTLTIDSAGPGQGTTVLIQLPRADGEDDGLPPISD